MGDLCNMSFFQDDALRVLPQPHTRRFLMVRNEDVSGVSGTGVVAEGVVFTQGRAVLHWLVDPCSVAVYESMDDLVAIHGHNGSTVFHYIDNNGG